MNKKLVIIAILVFTMLQAFSQVKSYVLPQDMQSDTNCMLSNQYKVEVFNGESFSNIFTYMMYAPWKTNNCITTSWAQFEFADTLRIRVTNLNDTVDYHSVIPRIKNIKTTKIATNQIEFFITEPGQYSVEFEQGVLIKHPLLIFADAVSNHLPNTSSHVKRFKSGVHNIGEKFELKSGDTLIIEGGAYVKGQIYAENANNITIMGAGILSGQEFPARSANHMITMRNCDHVDISGITIIHAPRYMIAVSGKHHHFNNIKMLGWWFSTDGISGGNDVLIENCFFKVNDDAIKLYRSNTTVRNCVIWQMENGAPFQIGWNMSGVNQNFHVYNCDIIRVEHLWDNENLAVFCAIHGGSGHMKDYLYEDIRIDNSVWRIFHLITKPNRWGKWNTEQGNISDIQFKNITYYGEQHIPSLIKGHDKKHQVYNISFENISIGAKLIDVPDVKNFLIDTETTYNISFKGIDKNK